MALGVFICIVLLIETIWAWVIYKWRRRFLGNYLIPATMILICSIFWAISTGLPQNEVAGPTAIPSLFEALLVLFSLGLIYNVYKKKLAPDPLAGNLKKLALGLGIIFIHILTINFLGYFLSTFIFIVSFIYFLEYKNHLVIWGVGIGWTTFSYYIFYKLLYIQLPLGYLYERFFQVS